MCPPQAPVQAPLPEVETQLLRRGVSTQGPPAGEWRVDVDTWPPDPKLRITGAQSIPSGPFLPPDSALGNQPARNPRAPSARPLL